MAIEGLEMPQTLWFKDSISWERGVRTRMREGEQRATRHGEVPGESSS